MEQKLDLGDIIEAYCPVCKLVLDASVAAFDEDGSIAKVQCRTCGNFNKYYPPEHAEKRKERLMKRVIAMRKRKVPSRVTTVETKKKRVVTVSQTKEKTSAAKKDKKDQLKEHIEKWHKLTDGVSSLSATLYSDDRIFTEGDYVIHKEWGLGYVEKVIDENTIKVIFRLSTETLPMNRVHTHDA